MTQIDRYIFVLFARTIIICFFCLGGVFVVFHAFNKSMNFCAKSRRSLVRNCFGRILWSLHAGAFRLDRIDHLFDVDAVHGRVAKTQWAN